MTRPTGPEKPDAVLTTQPGPTGGEAVLAVFDIHDNFTGGLRRTGAQLDTIEILEYTDKAYPNAEQVTIHGMFPIEDSTDKRYTRLFSRSAVLLWVPRNCRECAPRRRFIGGRSRS